MMLIMDCMVDVGIREPPAAPMERKCDPLGCEIWIGEMELMGRALICRLVTSG